MKRLHGALTSRALFAFLGVGLASLVCACSGGGGTIPQTAASQGGLSASAGVAAAAIRETQSDALNPRQAVSVPSSNDLVYISNSGNNTITVYHHDAQGDTAPLYSIGGSKTGIVGPSQLSEDAQGNLYVVTGSFSLFPAPESSVLVFAHGARGNVAPIRTIYGPATELSGYASGMIVDKATGKIFVNDNGAGGTPQSLLRFAPNANGNAAPFARGTIPGYPSGELALDSTGNNIITAHPSICCTFSLQGVETFPRQFSNNTTLSSIYSLIGMKNGFSGGGVADDPATKTYLYSSGAGIYRFAENTTGTGTEDGPASFNLAPISLITSDTCGGYMALGYLRNIYIVHNKQSGCPTDAMYVYTPDASGNAAPLRVLTGPNTQLKTPSGIYEGK
ncbi:MAG: hypothetical protein ABSB70_07855 [Candidatus Velthaea sp.]